LKSNPVFNILQKIILIIGKMRSLRVKWFLYAADI